MIAQSYSDGKDFSRAKLAKAEYMKMGNEVVLIAYSEIGLKSPPVRRKLEHQLARNIVTSLKRREIVDVKVKRVPGRLILEGGNPRIAVEVVAQNFGVTSAIHAIQVTSELDTIIQEALDDALRRIKNNQTFAVRARRVGKHTYTSKEIEARVGEEVLRHLKSKGVKVNLDAPDVKIGVEVRNGEAYIYRRVIDGPSGLPFSSQGKLISLFSGGIDSPVAAWFMMKRGANVKLLYLDQRPFVGDDYYIRALNVAKRLRQYIPLRNYTMCIAPMGEAMEKILENVPVKLTCLLCKRVMYRIACGLAVRMGAEGIVTGENLGQVASQTLANLKVLDEVSSVPVYRPLIGFEKMEIVAWGKKIGTFEASTTRIHGCSAVPGKPATRAKVETVLDVERSLPIDRLVYDSLDRIVHVNI